MLRTLPFVTLLAACSPDEEGAGAGAEEVLRSPLTDPELISAIQGSFDVVLATTIQAPWAGHAATLAAGDGACPARNAGEPYGQDIEGGGTVSTGESWIGECETPLRSYTGYMFWEVAAGETTSQRALFGNATVSVGDLVEWEFDGDASDRLDVLPSGATYFSEVDATVTGILATGARVGPGGYRANLFVDLETGASPTFEADGDVLLYEDLFDGKFDSVHVDVEMEKTSTSTTDCTAEPRGTISFRDADARWYDVVFAPKYNSNLEYESELSACDGCGTVYWRGYEQREICLDFDFLWNALETPTSNDFAL